MDNNTIVKIIAQMSGLLATSTTLNINDQPRSVFNEDFIMNMNELLEQLIDSIFEINEDEERE